LRCLGCGALFPVEEGIPRMLDDRLPGIAEKRAEIAGWPAMARAEGWYEPDDEVDAHLPYLTRDLDWEDTTWKANEHSFGLLLGRYVRPGMRVLEVGAAKAWAARHLVPLGVEYVATDILADPNIGLGRGAFYEARVGPFARVQADGEHLPFVDGAFDLVYCVAALHHALDLGRMVAEMARVTRRGGTVAALNEGTRAVRASGAVDDQEHEKSFGINEHVHTLYAYLWAFWANGLVVGRVEHAEGDDDLRDRRVGGKLRRLPLVGRPAATWLAQTCYGYSGVSLYSRKVAL
jgi:SAM-dependent methyltransferase